MNTKTVKKRQSRTIVKNKINFITNSNGDKKAAIVPINEYNKMIEELEDIRDIKVANQIMKNNPKFIKFDSKDYE